MIRASGNLQPMATPTRIFKHSQQRSWKVVLSAPLRRGTLTGYANFIQDNVPLLLREPTQCFFGLQAAPYRFALSSSVVALSPSSLRD